MAPWGRAAGPAVPAAPPRPSPRSGGRGSALPPREVPGQRRLRRYLRGRLTSAPPGAPAAARRPLPHPGRAGGTAAQSPSFLRDRAARGCGGFAPRRVLLCRALVPVRSSDPRRAAGAGGSRCPARLCPVLLPQPSLNRPEQRCGAGATRLRSRGRTESGTCRSPAGPAREREPAPERGERPPPGSRDRHRHRSGSSSPRPQAAAGARGTAGPRDSPARCRSRNQQPPRGARRGRPTAAAASVLGKGRRSSHRPPRCRRPGFHLAAPLEPKGCVRHRLDINNHHSCFLSTGSLFSCRKLLVLFLGKNDGNRERQARSASPTQTRMLQAPGSQSRAGTRFPPVQHPELSADVRNDREELKSCAACSLSAGLVLGAVALLLPGNGVSYRRRSLLARESFESRGWAESSWGQT
ncbi:translation initiation factor IF-2-like [Pipra filicauda]|uniref:Translation initiation factor IF-2-like n=1 Tax=Pipra filicauda TaxID=649802 RepID=A0A7R5K9C0_9PASS|nr:translation initiation factor IF-2-like [Pipra filicauda]